MDYKKIYENLILHGKSRELSEYKERHHIIPKCMGGGDTADNLVDLTPEEHYVAHQLLVKIYPTNRKLLYAVMMMSAGTEYVKRNNKQYGWLKRKFSIQQSGDNHIFIRNPAVKQKNQDYMRSEQNPGKNQPKGKDHWKYGIPFDSNCLTDDGRKILAEKMRGEKNPCAGIKPWLHPRATDYSKSIWIKADILYKTWLDNEKPSYCKLYTLINKQCYTNDNKVIGPYMNIIKYFRNGWVPIQDSEWIDFKMKLDYNTEN